MTQDALKKFRELEQAMLVAYGELFRAQIDEDLLLELAARGVRKADVQAAYEAVRKIGMAALETPQPV